MHRPLILRTLLPVLASSCLLLSSGPVSAQSTKDRLSELQDQVHTLTDMVQRLQSTVDSRMGVVQHLVEQSVDSVNQMNAAVATMQQKLNAHEESSNGKLDAVSGQVQSLNDSVDELKSRIAKLDKQLQDIQTQLQNVQAPPPGSPMPGGAPGTPGQQSGAADSVTPGAGASQAPPLQETYQSGLRDYNAAHYDTAASEFGDVLHYYPQDDLAGNAQFYIGEIAYRQAKYKDAVKAYNAVLEQFSGSPKAPAAQLRKGSALLALGQKDAGIHELRSLVQRHPQTPEAAQARSKLSALGVRTAPAR